jgi:hypothetical protein
MHCPKRFLNGKIGLREPGRLAYIPALDNPTGKLVILTSLTESLYLKRFTASGWFMPRGRAGLVRFAGLGTIFSDSTGSVFTIQRLHDT